MAPGSAVSRPVALFVQPSRDGVGAEPVFHVEPEDVRDERRLVFFDHEGARRLVDEVAEGPLAAAPLAAGSLAFHAGDHAVDNGGTFELCEDAEHLYHHPARRRRGVEGFGGRAEGDTCGVEILEDLGEAAHRAREPVDPVHEQQVEAFRLRLQEGALEVGPFQAGPAHLVGELPDELPAVLAVDVLAKPIGLGAERERLVLLVGGDAGVGGDPHGSSLGPRGDL
ncbi:MAG: hypothetical protein M0014_08220 [Actinomycetota bacterium]|nr:hypothetical protein [Actinomycetota bacterium]